MLSISPEDQKKLEESFDRLKGLEFDPKVYKLIKERAKKRRTLTAKDLDTVFE